MTSGFTRTENLLVKGGSPYDVVNLDSSAPQIVVKHYLTNSNGERRSDVDETWTGRRGVYTQWATPGYIYGLSLARQNWWDGPAYINGSWSPDSY